MAALALILLWMLLGWSAWIYWIQRDEYWRPFWLMRKREREKILHVLTMCAMGHIRVDPHSRIGHYWIGPTNSHPCSWEILWMYRRNWIQFDRLYVELLALGNRRLT